MKPHKISRLLGHGLAHVQNIVDNTLDWGFKKLQNAGDKKPKKNEHTIIRHSKTAAKFLGEMGTAYFEKYKELKTEKIKPQKKKRNR